MRAPFPPACRWKGVCEPQKHVKHECSKQAPFLPQAGEKGSSERREQNGCTKTIVFYCCFARVCFLDGLFSRPWGRKGACFEHSCFTCFWSSQTPFHRQAEEKVHSHAFAWCEQNSNNSVLFFSIARVLRGFEHLVFKLKHCLLHCFLRKHIQKTQNTHNYKFLVREMEKGNAGTNFPKS